MKAALLAFLMIMSARMLVQAQDITGRILDQTGIGLPGVQLELYLASDRYTTATTSEGFFTFLNVTAVPDDPLPSGYAVSEVFPNPFNPISRVCISLPMNSRVTIAVYDLLGQKCIDVLDQYLDAGTSFVNLSMDGMANGVYLARITLGEKHTTTKKLVLLYGSQHLPAGTVGGMSLASPGGSELRVNKVASQAAIDSLVATDSSIVRTVFTGLPPWSGTPLDLGPLVVNASPPVEPQLVLPLDGAQYICSSPLLIWNKCDATLGYRLQVSLDPSFTGFEYDIDLGATPSFQLDALAEATEYYWRINARNKYGTSSWSTVRSFKTMPDETQYQTTLTQVVDSRGGVLATADGTTLGVCPSNSSPHMM